MNLDFSMDEIGSTSDSHENMTFKNFLERPQNKNICKGKNKVFDMIKIIHSLTWHWTGYVARHTENWSRSITIWRPWEERSVGRPHERWYDEIKNGAGLI